MISQQACAASCLLTRHSIQLRAPHELRHAHRLDVADRSRGSASAACDNTCCCEGQEPGTFCGTPHTMPAQTLPAASQRQSPRPELPAAGCAKSWTSAGRLRCACCLCWRNRQRSDYQIMSVRCPLLQAQPHETLECCLLPKAGVPPHKQYRLLDASSLVLLGCCHLTVCCHCIMPACFGTVACACCNEELRTDWWDDDA